MGAAHSCTTHCSARATSRLRSKCAPSSRNTIPATGARPYCLCPPETSSFSRRTAVPPMACCSACLRSWTAIRSLARFVEKPAMHIARELFSAKALWNSFIFAATGSALLGLLRLYMGASVDDMATALARDAQSAQPSALMELYERLRAVDFSRAIVQQAPQSLRVITSPACGWNDLGTPRRVGDTLRRLGDNAPRPRTESRALRHMLMPGLINLAAQHARMALAG